LSLALRKNWKRFVPERQVNIYLICVWNIVY
jgi:hypothetical protein